MDAASHRARAAEEAAVRLRKRPRWGRRIPMVGGPVLMARIVSKVDPQYTDQARNAKWQGTVTLNVIVDESGKPSDITVVKPLGLGLDESAVTAVSQWRFQPTQLNGAPSKVQAQIEVPFKLQ